MSLLLDRLPHGSRVLIVRLRSLGDCVLTTPALELLHHHRPDLRVGVVVEDRFRAVFTGNPGVSEILGPSLVACSRFRPELTLNFHGGTRSLWMTLASLAGHRGGFAHYRHGWGYNVTLPRAQEVLGEERTVHTAEHLASAMFFLGVPSQTIPRASLYLAKPAQGRKPYAVLHPMASAAEKAWPPGRFVEVAEFLRSHWNVECVFLGGSGEDLTPFQKFVRAVGRPLEEVKELLSGAAVFVGNDSGPAHMAAAFGVPVVVLFGPSNPAVWAPWRTESEVLVAPNQRLADISIEQVTQALDKLRVRA